MAGERRTDPEKRDRLDRIQEEYRQLAERNLEAITDARRKTRRILTVLSVALLALGGWSVWFQVQQSDTAGQAADAAKKATRAAAQARTVAKRATGLAAAIQASRLDLIGGECRQQNRQHDAAVRTLRRVAAHSPAQPGQTKAQRERGVAEFIFILDAQTPHRDCDQVVAAAKLNRPRAPG